MMIGAMVSGPLADRSGRRPVLIGCALIFGVGSLLTATAQSIEVLAGFRFLTGLGMGGAMPNAIALTSSHAASPQGHCGDNDDLRVLAGSCSRWIRGGIDHPSLRMAGGVHRWGSDPVARLRRRRSRGFRTRFVFFS